MKILHLITGLEIGGAEMMLYRLCNQQLIAGDEPVVISLKSGGKVKELLENENISVVELGFPKGRFSLSGFNLLLQRIKQFRPDVIHCWMYHANLIGSFVSILLNDVPMIWAIHNTTLSAATSSKLTILIMRIGGLLSFIPDRIVYCSDISKSLHEKYLYARKRGVIIPNGVDVRLFSPNRSVGESFLGKLNIDSNQTIVGIIARFDPQKDYQNFVHAANYLQKKNIDIQFVMCGPGVDNNNSALLEVIRQTENPSRFHLIGTQLEVEKVHNSFDIFVSSSAYGEAFPIVLAEAMACGVPCVTTNVGDAGYIVGDTGKVVPPRNPMAIAEAVEELLLLSKEQWKDLKQAARNRIVEKFSLPKIAQQYRKTYTDIINSAM